MYIVYTELGTTWVRTCPWEGGCTSDYIHVLHVKRTLHGTAYGVYCASLREYKLFYHVSL